MNKKQTGGYSTKVKITDKRNSKIIKYKKDSVRNIKRNLQGI